VLVDLTGRILQFVGEQIHQVLHEVALPHQQILPDTIAVTFELVLTEQEVEQLLVRLQMRIVYPLLQPVQV